MERLAQNAGVGLPPSGNTGVKVSIDWLRCTGPETAYTLPEWEKVLSDHLRLPIRLAARDRGLYGYAEGAAIVIDLPGGERMNLGYLLWGGESMRGTCCFELNGTGCGFLEQAGQRHNLGGLLRCRDFRITRVDPCADFLDGAVTVDAAKDAYAIGEFNTGGRPPSARLIDDFGSGEGRTLYIGKRSSEKLLRIYEKGRQLGNRSSPWVRVEAELKRGNSTLSWDILNNPAAALAHACPWIASRLNAAAESYRVRAMKLRITADRLIAEARRCYGHLVNALHREVGLSARRVVTLLARPGCPESLRGLRYEKRGILALGGV